MVYQNCVVVLTFTTHSNTEIICHWAWTAMTRPQLAVLASKCALVWFLGEHFRLQFWVNFRLWADWVSTRAFGNPVCFGLWNWALTCASGFHTLFSWCNQHWLLGALAVKVMQAGTGTGPWWEPEEAGNWCLPIWPARVAHGRQGLQLIVLYRPNLKSLRIKRIFGISIYSRDTPICVIQIYLIPCITPHGLHSGAQLFYSKRSFSL